MTPADYAKRHRQEQEYTEMHRQASEAVAREMRTLAILHRDRAERAGRRNRARATFAAEMRQLIEQARKET